MPAERQDVTDPVTHLHEELELAGALRSDGGATDARDVLARHLLPVLPWQEVAVVRDLHARLAHPVDGDGSGFVPFVGA